MSRHVVSRELGSRKLTPMKSKISWITKYFPVFRPSGHPSAVHKIVGNDFGRAVRRGPKGKVQGWTLPNRSRRFCPACAGMTGSGVYRLFQQTFTSNEFLAPGNAKQTQQAAAEQPDRCWDGNRRGVGA